MGSYSIATTLFVVSEFRLKSMILYFWRLPPPWWRTVMRPVLLRPALFFRTVTRPFSGFFFVISLKEGVTIFLLDGVVGLYVFVAIV